MPKGGTPQDWFWEKVVVTPDHWLWTGRVDADGYGIFQVLGSWPEAGSHRAHRLAWRFLVGETELDLDHRCHRRDCVNPDHLRPATPKQNGENRNGVPVNNTSGVRGVSWHRRDRKWVANAVHHGKQFCAGRFDEIEEAERAVIRLRNQLFTHSEMDGAWG